MAALKQRHLSDCEDACPGLLNLYPIRILTVRSRALKLARVRLSIKRQLPLTFHVKRSLSYVLVSCTTISVYVNLSKNVLPKRAHQRSATPSERRLHLICGCKGTLFPRTGKTFRDFFLKKMHFCHLYIIYYICARNEWDVVNGFYGENGMDGEIGKDTQNG